MNSGLGTGRWLCSGRPSHGGTGLPLWLRVQVPAMEEHVLQLPRRLQLQVFQVEVPRRVVEPCEPVPQPLPREVDIHPSPSCPPTPLSGLTGVNRQGRGDPPGLGHRRREPRRGLPRFQTDAPWPGAGAGSRGSPPSPVVGVRCRLRSPSPSVGPVWTLDRDSVLPAPGEVRGREPHP